MANDGSITYSAGITEHLYDIKAREKDFSDLVQQMDGLKKQVEASWDQDSAQAFYAAHSKWLGDVNEIQEVLRSIIARATDGVGDMADTEKKVASMFHG